MRSVIPLSGLLALGLTVAVMPLDLAFGQQAETIEEVVVTGSRIRRDPLNEPTAVMELGRDDLVNSGFTNLGDALQNLPITGSAPNSQYNIPGNQGFPQDGAGIGAGSVQLALRNLKSIRTLILVDGRRWIAGASASGVPGTVDLNSLPDNMVNRIEILQDGASAIYGSDAIGGVVNIITDRNYSGFEADVQTGSYLSYNDGESTSAGIKFGGGNDRSHFVISASYREERGIETADRKRAAFPNPNATSCDVPGSYCSSFTPQGRFILGPALGGASITLNDGVLNDGGANKPVFNPDNPASGDFHAFTAADRFNYNGPGFNFLRTPNERVNIFASARHQLTDRVEVFGTFSYTNRSSATKAAPEPLYLGSGAGNPILENFLISKDNPYNPFGVDLSLADGTMAFVGRRPLESGGRLFFQDTDTYFATIGVQGDLDFGERTIFWELYGSYGDNQGFQEKENSHNGAKLLTALGDPAFCAATPGCVPFNIFGGQGPDGQGSITPAMREWVTYTQRDYSEQTLKNFAFNVSGEIFSLPAGDVGFAAGIEYRDHDGSFRPDPIAASGDTAGIPSGPTDGDFDVTEYYGELSVPLVDNGSQYWELNGAVRASDYSSFGSEVTYKVSTLFQPVEQLSLRGSYSTGFRAPYIGELFGGAAREDFTFQDPCTDVLGLVGSANGGRDAPAPGNIMSNCAALGVPTSYVQPNPSLNAISAGNDQLDPETSDSFTVGAVWSSSFDTDWIARLTASVDYYDLQINDAIQGLNPSDVLVACVNTLDPQFCGLTPRSSNGVLGVIDNQLQNIGGIDSSGFDVAIAYSSPDWPIGQVDVTFNASFLSDYEEATENIDGTETVTDRTGTHTNETFQRAFPDLRWTTTVDWAKNNWGATVAFRWTDSMELPGGGKVDSGMFTDLRLSYSPRLLGEGLTATLGFNNVFDEDPPLCFPCGVIGMSQVVHDLPGRVGYLRLSYRQ